MQRLARSDLSVKRAGLFLTDKGFSKEEISTALTWAVETRHVQEEVFIHDQITRLYQKDYGPNWIKEKLLNKGYPNDKITHMLDAVTEEMWYDTARRAVFAKYKGKASPAQVYQFWLRRGFAESHIEHWIEEYE